MKNLVKQTLERDFDLLQYTDFVKNLFNEIQIQPQEIQIPDSFKEFIKKITFLSDFSDTQKKTVDIYAVELAGGTKVERARSFQRNIISKLLKDNTKDAGLVAFYSKDNPDWRLSFIKLDYKLTEKGVKVEVGTPPKRYSFLVGKSEPSHTAQKQLLPILEDQKNNPLLSDLEEAFSVERVTKEFYERYRKLFEDLSKDLKKNRAFQNIAEKENLDIDNFAKKLLGQIVFLYFLQKKGWIGVPQEKSWGQGDKFFLTHLFSKAKAEKQDFYDHYLEPLFYDTLNNPRRDEVDPAYSRYFDCKIPFLNGGLFEPDYDWKNTIVYLGNDIFEEIVDTFDLYNFTVKEDEPLEKEVAVDPEMLGKVFENLLQENIRKGQGAYYTPREIVHYMCQESLINHLNTETKIDAERIRKLIAFKDEDLVNGNGSRKKTLGFSDDEAQSLDRALANIKVCDPACGSGAFLVGMLNEIVSARRILELRSEYKLKKETIQECIYGVDIDPGAVDIAKLRLWLSLVVDFELRDIEPLPNLDYKIMCGNSLVEELIVGDESIKLFDERLLDEKFADNISVSNRNAEIEKQIKEKERELQKIKSFDAKLTRESMQRAKEIEKDIKVLKKSILIELSGDKHAQDDFYKQKGHYFEDLRILHKQYFTEYDPIRKKEKREQIEAIELEFIKSSIKEKVNEFDSRISNLNMQDPGDRKKQGVLMKKKLEYLAIPGQIRNSKTRPYFLWKLNFFEVFQEKGGFDVAIGNPPWGQKSVKFSESERKYFKERYPSATIGILDIFRLFVEQAIMLVNSKGSFANVLPDIILLKNYDSTRKFILDHLLVKRIDHWGMAFDSVNLDSCTLIGKKSIGEDGNAVICAIHTEEGAIVKKIPQVQFVKSEGYKFNLYLTDKTIALINKLKKEKRVGDFFDPHEGIHSGNIRKKLFIDKKINSNCRKLIFGRDEIGRYRLFWNGMWVNYDRKIIDKSIGEYAGLGKPEYFTTSKLVVRRTGDYILAAFDEDGYYFSNNVFVCLPRNESRIDIKFVLGILNSRLSTWFYRTIQPRKGKLFAELKINVLTQIPIKQVSLLEQKPLIDLVEKIIKAKRIDGNAEISDEEALIDSIVYDLFMLSTEEKKIIEDSF